MCRGEIGTYLLKRTSCVWLTVLVLSMFRFRSAQRERAVGFLDALLLFKLKNMQLIRALELGAAIRTLQVDALPTEKVHL